MFPILIGLSVIGTLFPLGVTPDETGPVMLLVHV